MNYVGVILGKKGLYFKRDRRNVKISTLTGYTHLFLSINKC
jgi:hypothetical protein